MRSIVFDAIGKLPDRSATEVLQRIAGVTINRPPNRADPMQGVGDGTQHFTAEGAGVQVSKTTGVSLEANNYASALAVARPPAAQVFPLAGTQFLCPALRQ